MNITSGHFYSIFTTEELENLNTILDKLSDAPCRNQKSNLSYGYTNGFKVGDPMYLAIKKIVIQRIELLLEKKIQLHVGMILKSISPFTIHSDYLRDDLNPDLAILIPLNLTALETHTVVFNEECLDDFSLYLSRTGQLEVNAKSLHKTICSHETEHRLERVSVQGIYKWLPGSVIYWDRKLLHCSDNYIDRDIKEKRALVLFTNNGNIE
jgi:hypothetical protein